MPAPKRRKDHRLTNLTSHFKELEKQQQQKPKASRKEEITKISAKLSEIETNKQTKNTKDK